MLARPAVHSASHSESGVAGEHNSSSSINICFRFEHLALEYDEDEIGELEEQGQDIRGFANARGAWGGLSLQAQQAALPAIHCLPVLLHLGGEVNGLSAHVRASRVLLQSLTTCWMSSWRCMGRATRRAR
jgi:hypothetical protein